MSATRRDNIIVAAVCIAFTAFLYGIAPKDEETGAGVPQYNVSISRYLAQPIPAPTRYVVW